MNTEVNHELLLEARDAIDELREEVLNLRGHNQFLAQKAEAYDALVVALGMRANKGGLMAPDRVSSAMRTSKALSKALAKLPQPPALEPAEAGQKVVSDTP